MDDCDKRTIRVSEANGLTSRTERLVGEWWTWVSVRKNARSILTAEVPLQVPVIIESLPKIPRGHITQLEVSHGYLVSR